MRTLVAITLWCTLACALTGCYAGARATRDVNAAWRGRTRAAIEARWGTPAQVTPSGDQIALRWSFTRRHIVALPGAEAELSVTPERAEGMIALSPGEMTETTTDVFAFVDGGGRVTRVEGPSLRWGAPRGVNLRWGTIFGMHAGLGRLDDTSTPLPSGGAYIGGMLGPTFGLVGCFSLVSGADDAGGAMAFAWGMAAQWWVAARVWLRGGPALVLDFDPGFDDATLSPGLTGGASFAIVRAGNFVLDLRLDLTASPSATFGSAGVGVNLN